MALSSTDAAFRPCGEGIGSGQVTALHSAGGSMPEAAAQPGVGGGPRRDAGAPFSEARPRWSSGRGGPVVTPKAPQQQQQHDAEDKDHEPTNRYIMALLRGMQSSKGAALRSVIARSGEAENRISATEEGVATRIDNEGFSARSRRRLSSPQRTPRARSL